MAPAEGGDCNGRVRLTKEVSSIACAGIGVRLDAAAADACSTLAIGLSQSTPAENSYRSYFQSSAFSNVSMSAGMRRKIIPKPTAISFLRWREYAAFGRFGFSGRLAWARANSASELVAETRMRSRSPVPRAGARASSRGRRG